MCSILNPGTQEYTKEVGGFGKAHPVGFIHRPPAAKAGAAVPPVRQRVLRARLPVHPVRPGAMTLKQLSAGYRESAARLSRRLRQLRGGLANATDPEEIWHIKRRIAELTPMLTQMNELAELTERYYEKGYYRSKKYTL